MQLFPKTTYIFIHILNKNLYYTILYAHLPVITSIYYSWNPIGSSSTDQSPENTIS